MIVFDRRCAALSIEVMILRGLLLEEAPQVYSHGVLFQLELPGIEPVIPALPLQ